MGPGVGGGRGKLASNVMRGMGVRGARGKTDLGQTITDTDRRLRGRKDVWQPQDKQNYAD